ncbi:universal stress protein [Actinoplanes sp. KI2]|uniref:universal stress protein n=1 Tax=Actinoplanes sp. KI2 TaxID=2983315 RepID=UPI0021D5A68C|nr:universal stress protein [Actinoplanes sp. KI2]MCU7726621.1 universal stress protein [Actinoplanes sp. KI2]
MRNPVVVGVTGTSAGLAAVRLAAREAVSRGCQLKVVHAFTWPSHGPPGAGMDYDRARRAASQVVGEAVLTAQRSTPGVRVTGQLVDGLPDRVLLRLSRAAVLLVLGDDDLATTPWLPPGSVLVQAVARSWCPVLVARGPRPPRGAVLAAVDGSANGMRALRHALAESRRRRATLEVLHVVREYGGADEEQGRQVLAEAAEAAPAAHTRLLAGAPGPTLVLASRRGRVIVLGPRGTRDAGLLGAVAREVLHRGACPTIFVHGRSVPVPRLPSDRKAGAMT